MAKYKITFVEEGPKVHAISGDQQCCVHERNGQPYTECKLTVDDLYSLTQAGDTIKVCFEYFWNQSHDGKLPLTVSTIEVV